jgi:dTMP kinase
VASRGRFITFEGPEGGGKSTQALALQRHLEEQGRVARLFREPGGTRISAAVRDILLAPEHLEMAPSAELLLFLAARAQLVAEEIRPALAEGCLVLCDRYTDSTLAYQLEGTGLELEALERLNDFATGSLAPDLTLLLDLDAETGLRRQEDWNRMEARGLEFHRRVRETYLSLARRDPRRIVVVDAARPVEVVRAAVWAAVDQLLTSPP